MAIKTPAKIATKFDYPYKTSIPKEVDAGWEDRSWRNDASACAWLKVPSAKTPKAVLCLWVQPDDKKEWDLSEQPRFQLDFIVDENEGWDEDTCRTLLTTDDIAVVMAEVAKHAAPNGGR